MSQTNARTQGGGLILPVGSSPGSVNAGENALIIDSDGGLKLQDMAGVKSSVSSGVGWDALQWARISALLNATTSQVDDYLFSHLLNPAEYDVTAGTGPFTQFAASTGGVLHAGAGSATLMFAGHKSAGGSVVPIPNIKTSAWAIASRFRFAATPVGAGVEIDVAGMLGSTQYLTLQIAVDTSASVLQIGQIGAGTTRTACSAAATIGSGIVVGTWYDALLANDVAGGRVVAQINGVTVGTSSVLTNSTTQAGRAFFDTSQAAAIDFDAILMAFKREP